MELRIIRSLLKQGKYKITLHAQVRMDQRLITLKELKETILQGKVVETYPHDKPFPSCLVMGKVRGGFPLYVVCALSDIVHIITTHWLDPTKWLDPTTRREKKKYE
jgi:hypothetical protein